MWKIARKPVATVILCALVLRVAAAFVIQDRLDHHWNRRFLIEGDANGYWELAERLAAGKPYEIYDPPRRILRMPGFPLLEAAAIRTAQWLGVPDWKYFLARLVLAAVGAITCGLVFVLGLMLFDLRTGVIAGGLAAVLPNLVAFSAVLLSETLFAFGIVASLVLMAGLVRVGFGRERRWLGVMLSLGCGAAIAGACYARPTWLLVGPLFGLAYVIWGGLRPEAWVRAGLIVVTMLLCLLPWGVRNHRVSGHWVFTTLWVGPSLYDGLNPEAEGDSQMEFFERERKTNPRLQQMSEYEIDRYYRAKAWEFVRQNPWRTVELAAIKFWRFWKPWPNAQQFGAWWQRLVVAAGFLPLAVLGAAGWWAHRRRFWAWALSLGPILYFSAIHTVFVGSLRYRLPAEYPLCVLAAAGVLVIVDAVRSRRGERAVAVR